jgi:hypothetical protein
MTEPIKSMYIYIKSLKLSEKVLLKQPILIINSAVAGDNLCISGSYVYNLYKDGKELAYYLCSDKINDLLFLPMTSADSKVTPVLACNDRVLRILDVNFFFYIIKNYLTDLY